MHRIEIMRFWNNEVLQNIDVVLSIVAERVTPLVPLTSRGRVTPLVPLTSRGKKKFPRLR